MSSPTHVVLEVTGKQPTELFMYEDALMFSASQEIGLFDIFRHFFFYVATTFFKTLSFHYYI